jgi:hypothetical protein
MLEAHNPEIGQKEGPGLRAASALSLAPIHPSAWNRNSPKFVYCGWMYYSPPSVGPPDRGYGLQALSATASSATAFATVFATATTTTFARPSPVPL